MTKHWTARAFARQRGTVSVALVLSAALGLHAPAYAGRVSGVDIGDASITVRFDAPVDKATSFALAQPDRIGLDITGVDPGTSGTPAGPVSAIRQGRFATDTTRLVFDLSAPTMVTGGSFSADGQSLTIGIAPAPDGDMERAIEASRKVYLPPASAMGRAPRGRYALSVRLDPPEQGPPPPRIAGRADRPLVVIDAGHGGFDPGALSPDGTREKDITLSVARAIRDELVRGGRVRVALTREDDRFLVLQERAQIARGLKADLFISIHADSAPNTGATGATIYTLSEVASDATAARLAARENKADVINGVNLSGQSADISSILIDLAQRETMNSSARFADLLKREASGAIPFRADYHRMAGFAVLKAPDTPAILLEVGYVTNTGDVARLTSPGGRAAIASSIRRAVDVQFARRMASR
jgi:N-acetylmuramoyl-L-alanine amidase